MMMQGLRDTFESYSAVFIEWRLCDCVHKGLSLDTSVNTPKNILLHSVRTGIFYSPCFTDWKSLSFLLQNGKRNLAQLTF